MPQCQHSQCCRGHSVGITILVCPRVLLQVILPSETFSAYKARMRTNPGVYPLVPRQLFVPRERLPTTLCVAFERSLACNEKSNEIY